MIRKNIFGKIGGYTIQTTKKIKSNQIIKKKWPLPAAGLGVGWAARTIFYLLAQPPHGHKVVCTLIADWQSRGKSNSNPAASCWLTNEAHAIAQ